MNRPAERKNLLLIIIIFIAVSIETDIYLPAFPDMMAWFSVSEMTIQSLITWNFIGVCISVPLYGPLSDAFGRKKPLMVGFGLFLIGSIMSIFAQNFDQMVAGRILQGLGSGGCFTLRTAIIFDIFQREKAIKAVNDCFMILPLLRFGAPILGSCLNSSFGFRANFLAIAILVFASLIFCCFFFKESLSKEKRTSFEACLLLKDVKQALSSRPFWQLTSATSLLYGGYTAFLTGASVLFVVEFKMSKTIFPFIQAEILAGWILGGLVLKYSIAKWGIHNIKRAGIALGLIGGATFACVASIAPKNPYLLASSFIIYSFSSNWITGLYFSEGMEILPHIKGICSSLMTSARLITSVLLIGLTSSFYNGTIYPLACVIIGTVIVVFYLLTSYEKERIPNLTTSS